MQVSNTQPQFTSRLTNVSENGKSNQEINIVEDQIEEKEAQKETATTQDQIEELNRQLAELNEKLDELNEKLDDDGSEVPTNCENADARHSSVKHKNNLKGIKYEGDTDAVTKENNESGFFNGLSSLVKGAAGIAAMALGQFPLFAMIGIGAEIAKNSEDGSFGTTLIEAGSELAEGIKDSLPSGGALVEAGAKLAEGLKDILPPIESLPDFGAKLAEAVKGALPSISSIPELGGLIGKAAQEILDQEGINKSAKEIFAEKGIDIDKSVKELIEQMKEEKEYNPLEGVFGPLVQPMPELKEGPESGIEIVKTNEDRDLFKQVQTGMPLIKMDEYTQEQGGITETLKEANEDRDLFKQVQTGMPLIKMDQEKLEELLIDGTYTDIV